MGEKCMNKSFIIPILIVIFLAVFSEAVIWYTNWATQFDYVGTTFFQIGMLLISMYIGYKVKNA